MAQKGEDMLTENTTVNEWLLNVQLFPRVWILEISKCFEYPYPVPVWKQFLDIRIWLQTHYLAAYPTGKPDSDHLWLPDVIKEPEWTPARVGDFYRCQAKFLTYEMSDLTPCALAQSNILHIKYAAKSDN